jgi:tetratricopeptide (TPR) repeat protein
MKRWFWAILVSVVLVAAGLTLVAFPRDPEWTSSSADARAEFTAGEDALRKVYTEEAAKHFRRALELDSDFLVAKWRLSQMMRPDESEQQRQLTEEVLKADLSSVTARERCMISYWRAAWNDQGDESARILDACIEEIPNDPYPLAWKAGRAWRAGHLEEAERLYQELLAIDPNWVVAYNALGYIKMMQTAFNEAEESFKSYRFIAPEQANPHDSLGELFMTIGRYSEAEESFEKAIEVRPDFWASYEHLAVLKSYTGDFAAVRGVIDRAAATGMPEPRLRKMSCRATYAEMAAKDRWKEILDQHDGPCVEGFFDGLSALLTHRAACETGDWRMARTIEDEAMGLLIDAEKDGNGELVRAFRAGLLHMQGIRAAFEGDLPAAQQRFQAADELLTFIAVDDGMYKLYNRMLLAETLLTDGKDAEAHSLLASIRSVNPAMVEDFEESGFRFLGLDRG